MTIEFSKLEFAEWLEPPTGLTFSKLEFAEWLEPYLRISKTLAYVRLEEKQLRVSKTTLYVRLSTTPLELRPVLLTNNQGINPGAVRAAADGVPRWTTSGALRRLAPHVEHAFSGGASAGQVLRPPTIYDPPALPGATFVRYKKNGDVNPGDIPGNQGGNEKYASKVTLEAGNVTALAAFSSKNANISSRMAVYADAGGTPGALLGVTVVLTSIVKGYNTYVLLNPFAVAAGDYWIALQTDGNFNTWLISGAGVTRMNADAFSDGISNPFGASTPVNNKTPVYAVQMELAPQTLKAVGLANSSLLRPPEIVAPEIPALEPPQITSTAASFAPGFQPLAVDLSLATLVGETVLVGPGLVVGPVSISPGRLATSLQVSAPSLAPQPVSIGLSDAVPSSSAALAPTFKAGAVGIVAGGLKSAVHVPGFAIALGAVEISLVRMGPAAALYSPAMRHRPRPVSRSMIIW